jgi:hypothetical protein
MRAREILYEDSRSTIRKLEDLINHPNTEDTIKAVARSKLKLLVDNEPVPEPSRLTVTTNISEGDLDRPFIGSVQLGSIYEGLAALQPGPNQIHFLRQGQINMMVPPPMMGKTRQQYFEEIGRVCPGVKNITARMVEGEGYFFTISFI